MVNEAYCPYCGKKNNTAREEVEEEIFVAENGVDGPDWHDHAFKWSCGYCETYFYTNE